MKVITEQALLERIADLAQDRNAVQIDANEQLRAIDGMINDCRYWLAQLAESKPGRKAGAKSVSGQPSPDALRKRAARARKPAAVPPPAGTGEPSAAHSDEDLHPIVSAAFAAAAGT